MRTVVAGFLVGGAVWTAALLVEPSEIGWPPGVTAAALAGERSCTPTPSDAEGPFYKPNAPARASIGRGLVVAGVVRSVGNCAPIPNAQIEWWQANPQGQYDDAHRAIQAADGEGRYRFETSFPPAYFGRPPHIHVKVLAPGHRPLTTQIYPKGGQTEIAFDFVVLPR